MRMKGKFDRLRCKIFPRGIRVIWIAGNKIRETRGSSRDEHVNITISNLSISCSHVRVSWMFALCFKRDLRQISRPSLDRRSHLHLFFLFYFRSNFLIFSVVVRSSNKNDLQARSFRELPNESTIFSFSSNLSTFLSLIASPITIQRHCFKRNELSPYVRVRLLTFSHKSSILVADTKTFVQISRFISFYRKNSRNGFDEIFSESMDRNFRRFVKATSRAWKNFCRGKIVIKKEKVHNSFQW